MSGFPVEEYARHNGHVDLLRERIDGAVDSSPLRGCGHAGSGGASSGRQECSGGSWSGRSVWVNYFFTE
jgi:hypothetical protein